MLEKSKGNINIEKLRAILLLEADLNALHKIIFNEKVLPTIKRYNQIPKEVIEGRRDQSVHYIALNKKLLADISNQIKCLLIVISADTINYFD